MTKREPDIKTRILLAAKKLFALQGYDGTSVRQICDEAGANLSLVSYHFGGKEKVFEALFERYFLVRIPDEHDSSMSPVEGLVLIIRELIRFTSVDREMSDIVQLEMALRTNRNAAMYPFLEPIWTRLTGLLQAGKDQGIFRIDSVSYSMLMVLSVSLSPQRAFNTKFMVDFEQENPDHLADQTVTFALRGLGVSRHEWTNRL
ncbi:TetR/AcrR family transcriptional regulator [Paenibacillus sp. PK3_47]|uniref:TetR family transcriptional regulator n=1 Tax=Paenibacillus sp. PK3_47 TaxID=2072642 RepID=UPI00201D4881|nr:TetR family transcriptional regulator [Paenibacillus sp. PK3_47]UQZ36044.1 TetR/AcrR family transcriptional regulator [Paenibacillus sp. PK3_47]